MSKQITQHYPKHIKLMILNRDTDSDSVFGQTQKKTAYICVILHSNGN